MSKSMKYIKRAGMGLLALIVLLGGTGDFILKVIYPIKLRPDPSPKLTERPNSKD